jgi:hypothetical protein
MNVAVEISGFIRGFEKCVPSWVNFLNPSNTYDFFLSTYSVYGFNNHNHMDFDVDDHVDFDSIITPLKEYGNVCGLTINEPSEENRYKQMFDRISEVHDLCKSSGRKYDYVVRIRPDIYFSDKLKIRTPEMDEAVFPLRWGFCEFARVEDCRWTGGHGLCDQMAVCGWEAMQVYADIGKNSNCQSLGPESAILHSFKDKRTSHQEFNQCVLSRIKS